MVVRKGTTLDGLARKREFVVYNNGGICIRKQGTNDTASCHVFGFTRDVTVVRVVNKYHVMERATDYLGLRACLKVQARGVNPSPKGRSNGPSARTSKVSIAPALQARQRQGSLT